MKLVWLSHVIGDETPLYGVGKGTIVCPDRSMNMGDTCNTSSLSLSSHMGTHVDAPYHFLPDGKTIDEYPPSAWIFEHPEILNIAVEPGMIIGEENLSPEQSVRPEIDLVIIRTGFELFRNNDIYWQNGPGLSPCLANALVSRYPDLRAVGIDFLSISSLGDRETGREAHRAFLGKGLLLFEDMFLSGINFRDRLIRVMAFPLRIVRGDGAPCTILGICG